jgi:outer membrane immunogenic protein
LKQAVDLFLTTLLTTKSEKGRQMKKVFLALALLVAVIAVFAQNPVAVGQTQFNLGVGFSNWGVPVYAGLDYGAGKDVTLGGELSYNSYRENWHDAHYNHSIFGIAGNVNYHFNHVLNIPTNWDFYAGLNLGYYIWESPDNYPGDHNSGIGLGAQIGGRYYFSNSAGINLELGGSSAFSGGKIGLSFKL